MSTNVGKNNSFSFVEENNLKNNVFKKKKLIKLLKANLSAWLLSLESDILYTPFWKDCMWYFNWKLKLCSLLKKYL